MRRTPDEYLTNDLKQTIKNKPPAKTRDGPVATTSSILIYPEAPGSDKVILPLQNTCVRPLEESSVCLKYY
jgi:hypothetical protein